MSIDRLIKTTLFRDDTLRAMFGGGESTLMMRDRAARRFFEAAQSNPIARQMEEARREVEKHNHELYEIHAGATAYFAARQRARAEEIASCLPPRAERFSLRVDDFAAQRSPTELTLSFTLRLEETHREEQETIDEFSTSDATTANDTGSIN